MAMLPKPAGLFLLALLLLSSVPVDASALLLRASSDQTTSSNDNNHDPLSSHWVKGNGYRDELNASDIDYQNFWTDNAGKILVASELTNDTVDANNALWFLYNNGLRPDNYYLPETVVNSSSVFRVDGTLTNRIAMLQATNSSSPSKLEQLAVGNYYAGKQPLAYLGSDRILINGVIYRASSSSTFQSPNGFVKRSLFSTSSGGEFYVYLNATLSPGAPYANLSLQVMPLNQSTAPGDLLYLQVFSTNGQFNNASLYDGSGNYQRAAAYNAGSPPSQNGTIITYSRLKNVIDQDSIALSFSGNTASSPVAVDDLEHWYQNRAFDGLSWIGVAYDAPQVSAGRLSSPIFSSLYPIDHLDYHLINDTAKYIALARPNGTTVSAPVSFGFVAYGLALASLQNKSLGAIARGYWNYYYSRYASFADYSTPYARAINLLALAGFTLYGCSNSTIQKFTRNFVGNTSGSAVEEFAWGAAALYQLQKCTSDPGDIAFYRSFVNSFEPSRGKFVTLNYEGGTRADLDPASTFQFGEAAAGLMLGQVPYNDPAVLGAMDAVFQSNVSGTLLNQPFRGDVANTETIPAYLLSTALFQSGMREDTGGYYIFGLRDANVTSIEYKGGSLMIGVRGSNGTIQLSLPNGSSIAVTNINGFSSVLFEAMNVASSSTATDTTTVTSSVTTTNTSRVTITSTSTVTCYFLHTSCSSRGLGSCTLAWMILSLSAVFFAVGATLLAVSRRRYYRH